MSVGLRLSDWKTRGSVRFKRGGQVWGGTQAFCLDKRSEDVHKHPSGTSSRQRTAPAVGHEGAGLPESSAGRWNRASQTVPCGTPASRTQAERGCLGPGVAATC